jgi:hypothetical protein
MIRCEQAERLFDAYLDGSLAASWTAELHAHQLACSACRRELAILEACGDVLATDRREPRPSDDFTDRVLGALAEQQAEQRRIPWPRRVARVGAGLGIAAAAAVVAFMLMAPGSLMKPGETQAPQVVGGAFVSKVAPLDDQDKAVAGTQVDFAEAIFNMIDVNRVEASIEEVRGLGQVGQAIFDRMLETTNEKVEGLLLSEEAAPE